VASRFLKKSVHPYSKPNTEVT